MEVESGILQSCDTAQVTQLPPICSSVKWANSQVTASEDSNKAQELAQHLAWAEHSTRISYRLVFQLRACLSRGWRQDRASAPWSSEDTRPARGEGSQDPRCGVRPEAAEERFRWPPARLLWKSLPQGRGRPDRKGLPPGRRKGRQQSPVTQEEPTRSSTQLDVGREG